MFKISLSIIILLVSFRVGAQAPPPYYNNKNSDIFGSLEKYQIESLYQLYSNEIEPSFDLINGRIYYPYYVRSKSKPLLFFDDNHTSSVIINGIRYDDINLDYDTYKDEVLYIDSTRICIYSPLIVALNKDNIDSFYFYHGKDTLSFRHIRKGSDPLFNLSAGYYEIVIDGDIKYIIKHISILKDLPGIDEYNKTQEGYVNVGNGFSKIINTRQFIKLFGSSSGDIKKYIEESRIKIRKASKEQILGVLQYYDNNKKLFN